MGITLFIAALVLAIAFAWWRGRKSPLLKELQSRPLKDADALRNELVPPRTLDPRTTQDVLQAMGKALEQDPGRLRLDDRFDALWDMDPQAGFHQRATFETTMLRRYPALPADVECVTLADMVEALQRLPMLRR